MTPAEVASLERQFRTLPLGGGDSQQHHWALVGEGIYIDLAVYESALGLCVAWMGAHAGRPFTVDGEAAEPNRPCKALDVDGWCVVDASRGDRLVKAWAEDQDDAPIWAALEELAGEVTR